MSRRKYILAFMALVMFFIWTAPGNHTEAEDAYEYSRLAEQASGSQLFHSHHLLYLPLVQGVLRLAQGFGYSGRALPVLMGVSIVSGAVVILMFSALVGRTTGSKCRYPFCLGLLFSYGFWRYACEAEIYMLAMFFSVAVFWLLCRFSESPLRGIMIGVLSVAGICMHVLNVMPLLLGVIAYFMIERRYKLAVFHVVWTLIGVAVVYGAVALSAGLYIPQGDTQPFEGGLNLSMFVKGAVGLSQALISGNFLFISPAFQQQIQELFPYRMFAEEIFMGSRATSGSFYAACGSLLLLGGCALFVLLRGRVEWRQFVPVRSASLCAAVCWLLGHFALVLFFEPGNPEMWVMGLLPLWWVGSLVFRRCDARLCHWVLICVLALGIHNWVGGMRLVRSESSDYYRVKLDGLMTQPLEEALVVTSGSSIFVFYLNYWTAAEVINLNYSQSPEAVRDRIQTFPGPVYFMADVLDPEQALETRFPKGDQVRQATAASFESQLRSVGSEVYQFVPSLD